MAETTILSPGVFTTETDASFLPAGISNIGAVIIGPTEKGPAFIPTIVKGYSDYLVKFGEGTNYTYIPQTVKNYLNNSPSVMVMRVLGNGGWSFTASKALTALVVSSSATGHTNEILAVFHPSKNTNANAIGLEKSRTTPTRPNITGSTFILTLSGSNSTNQSYTCSYDTGSAYYILKSVGSNEFNSISGSSYLSTGFPYINFKSLQSFLRTNDTGSETMLAFTSANVDFTSSIDGVSYSEGYASSATPWVTDGSGNKLFKFIHRSHGISTNTDVYISIANLREPANINDVEQYSTFNVLVRQFGDNDKTPNILEQFENVNLDPSSPKFIARVIGDRYYEYDSTLAKVVTKGNYTNISNYVRIVMSDAFSSDLLMSALSPKKSPRGFEKLYQTIIGFAGYNLPTASYKSSQTLDSVYNSRAFLGFDFTYQDNLNYLKPVPTIAGVASASINSDFTINSLNGHPSASWVRSLSASVDVAGISGPKSSQVQFSVPMQGGSDGINPAIIRNMGSDISTTNVFGYDLSTSATAGSRAFIKALNILSNQDEYDFNLISIPGVIHSLHSSVTQTAMDLARDRGDALYIMDATELNSTIATVVNTVLGIDNNYVATYYPWVKVLDTATNKPSFVPPSVLIPGVMSRNDKSAAPWFAPAGLNRGGISEAIETKNKVSQAERDVLYNGRVNPIAQFPGQGVVVFGQKTLQLLPSATDRINVRRLLIQLKKYIASSSRYLVFDQNTTQTRTRFLNLVNPYLSSIQQRQGLYSFKVVMNETNNTSDVIDRLQLVGKIYLQPTRAAEFILLDFTVLPTGALFPN